MNGNLAYQYEDGYREELIGGRLVGMSPRPAFNHNRIAFNIAHLFQNYLEGRKCTVIADGTDLYLSETDRFIPDTMIVCDPDKIRRDGVHGAPDLVVEVLSPGTSKNDRTRKKKIYAEFGVREYWLVEPGAKSIEVYLNEGGSFVLDEVYVVYEDWMLEQMTDEERAEVVTKFKCSLYDDFEIPLDRVFKGLLR